MKTFDIIMTALAVFVVLFQGVFVTGYLVYIYYTKLVSDTLSNYIVRNLGRVGIELVLIYGLYSIVHMYLSNTPS